MDKTSFWSIVAWSSCCTQNFKTPISVVWGLQRQRLCLCLCTCWGRHLKHYDQLDASDPDIGTLFRQGGPQQRLQSSNFCTEMGDKMMKQIHWVKGTQIWELSFCLFGKATISPFLGTVTFHQVWQISLRFQITVPHGSSDESVMTQIMKSRNHLLSVMLQVLPVPGGSVGTTGSCHCQSPLRPLRVFEFY